MVSFLFWSDRPSDCCQVASPKGLFRSVCTPVVDDFICRAVLLVLCCVSRSCSFLRPCVDPLVAFLIFPLPSRRAPKMAATSYSSTIAWMPMMTCSVSFFSAFSVVPPLVFLYYLSSVGLSNFFRGYVRQHSAGFDQIVLVVRQYALVHLHPTFLLRNCFLAVRQGCCDIYMREQCFEAHALGRLRWHRFS